MLQSHAELLISDIGGTGTSGRNTGTQATLRLVLRRVSAPRQVSTRLQHLLNGGITQEFDGAQSTLGDPRGLVKGTPNTCRA